jgi:hypothetical protein
VVLYRCEIWYLTLKEEYRVRTFDLRLREEHGLRIIVRRAMRRLLGLKKVEVMGWWIKRNNEELRKCNYKYI